jgi:hypothetical protein
LLSPTLLTSKSKQSYSLVGIKRGQQSTTNKNAKPLQPMAATNKVCSATNRVKKTFNFEVEEPQKLKTYLMQ